MGMLSNGLSGLLASQTALNVVSQNVANANVKGYSRQEVLLGTRFGQSNNVMDAGQGVQVNGIRRVTDDYLNFNLWRTTSETGEHKAYSDYLVQAEQVFGNDNLSISTGLDDLYSALNFASESPQSIAPRQQVLASAEALAERFNSLASNLDTQRTQILEQADGAISQVNTFTQEIATLNQKITEVTAAGANTSALEDQRDEAIKSLSELVEVRVSRQTDGSSTVTLAGGQPLVLGMSAATLTRTGSNFSVDYATQSFPFNGNVGGMLGGLLSYQDNVLDVTEAELSTIAQNLADDFNNQLALGQDLNGLVGGPLFDYDPLDPAGSISITAGYQAEDLAFGAIGAGTGDNTNINALIDLKDGQYDAYTGLVGGLAIQSGQALAEYNASTTITSEALAKRDSVSGVNLDEEAMYLMEYMQAYQANAKVISGADQIFNTLMGMF